MLQFWLSGGGCSFFSQQGVPPAFQGRKKCCTFFKETCIKACHTVLKECNGLLNCNCLLKNTIARCCSAFCKNSMLLRRTILQRTISWSYTALSYGNITLLQSECYIFTHMKWFSLGQELKAILFHKDCCVS